MKLRYFLAMLLITAGAVAQADASGAVPAFFNYQGALTDEGGNPLPDGISELKFKIEDPAGGVLYEEVQELDIVNGSVSAIIGNGLDPSSGAPMGGVPASALDPKETRFLRVEAFGASAYDPMEMVSVPYSVWAMGLADGALTSEMIGEKAVKVSHVSDELLQKIEEMGQSGFTDYRNSIQGSSGAGTVGVTSNFVYSGSATVQGVLKDLDTAIKKRQEEIEFNRNEYKSGEGGEQSARIAADAVLQNNINNEAGIRAGADNNLQGQITAHENAASTHGVSGDIVGMNDNQYLYNKILVAPTIVSGTNINPDIDVDLVPAANEGVVVAGNLKVSGNVTVGGIKLTNNPKSPGSNADVTASGQVKAWGSVRRVLSSDGVGFYDSYNCSSVTYVPGDGNWWYVVTFDKPFTNSHYIVSPHSDYGAPWGTGVNIGVVGKTVNGFNVVTTDGGTDRHGDIDWGFVVYGNLANQ